MAVDVVVVSYKTPQLLLDFAKSYDEVKFLGCTLTVVDVDPPDPALGDTYPVLGDTYIPIKENCGYGRACNIGAFEGKNDVILLANADTVLSGGFTECYDALRYNEDWGVLGPRQVNAQNQITAGGIVGPDQSPRQRGWNEHDQGQYSDILEDALSVSGSLYFIKRALWQKLTSCVMYQQASPGAVGAFLETPHYFDEMFCSLHARAHGFKCVYYGPVKMTHYWHAASPHGGWADQQFAVSQQMHRQACAAHGILCE
jgi:GT2 family glycosyltransferase